jgi:hypothetical protein
VARTRTIRVGCVDLPLPPCPWLQLAPPPSLDLSIYFSTLHDGDVRDRARAHVLPPAPIDQPPRGPRPV